MAVGLVHCYALTVLHADIGWMGLENCLGKMEHLYIFCTAFVVIELPLLIFIDNLFENMILLIHGKNADIFVKFLFRLLNVCLS